MKKLSNKLSVAILQALDDLELCMNDENYIIDFNQYHHPVVPIRQQFNNVPYQKCAVCFAGSIIAKRLKPNKFNESFGPNDFNNKTENMLRALDCIRMGYINDAFYRLDIKNIEINDVEVNQHEYNIFKSQMIDISNMLKENKL